MIKKLKQKATTIFFDMDGVLAQWNASASVEDTFKPDYFLTCELEPVVREVINILKKKYRVKILSHAYGKDAIHAKTKWLDMMGLGNISKLFIPYGKPKTDYIWGPGKKVLLDDFSKNLREWEEDGNIAIKFRNQINGTKGTWVGPSVRYSMSAEEIVDIIESTISQ